MNAALRQSWQQAVSQWQASRLLRWGVVAILVMLWSEGLVRLDELRERWLQDGRAVQADLARLNTYRQAQPWTARADEARRLVDAQERLLWQAPSAGLTEAAFQDWVRAVAAKSGVSVIELQVTRLTSAPALPAAPASAPGAALPAGVATLRAHLVGDLRRLPLLSMLNEIGLHERALVVERLMVMPNPQRPLFELDLRAPIAVNPAAAKSP